MGSPNGFHRRRLEAARKPAASQYRPGRSGRMSKGGSGSGGFIMQILSWPGREWRRLGWKKFLLRAAGVVFVLGTVYLSYLWFTLPDIHDPSIFRADQSTVITDRNGVELYRVFNNQDRTVIPDDQIPKVMKEAMVAIEDERFYEHGCVDPKGIFRAVLSQFLPFLTKSGGSTLEQQLARNALLTNERKVSRKIREVMIACSLERTYSKDQILALYLNWVPFGPNIYGVEQASKKYFGKSAKDLTLPEAAILAAMPQNPPYYNPYGKHPRTTVTDPIMIKIGDGRITKRSQIADKYIAGGLLGNNFGSGSIYIGGRVDQVLKNMTNQKYITEAQEKDALQKLLTFQFTPDRVNTRAPYFTEWVKTQLETMFDQKNYLEQGGLTIQTTLDWKLQQAAEQSVAKYRDNTLKLYGAHNIALIAMDPKTREILAYVGNSSANYTDDGNGTQIDMVQKPRQPGSSFKPITYSAAFLKGFGPGTVLYDVQTKFGDNTPKNFEGGFWGLTTIRKALAGSRNIPAIKALFLAGGEEAVLSMATKLGAPTPKEKQPGAGYGYPLAIGSAETPLLEMANVYSTLADQGKEKDPISIGKILDHNKAIRFQADLNDGKEVLDPRVAYEITSILSDNSARPGGFWQQALTVPGIAAAAKTGTSTKCTKWTDAAKGICAVPLKPHDLWTMGYTPNLVVGVWVGNADDTPLSDTADGLNVAAPIWKDFMIQAQKIRTDGPKDFPVPDGLVQPQISLLSGELPTDCTPVALRRSDFFLKENAPSLPDPACQQVEVDRVTGLLASDSCPAEAREMRSFLLPKEVADGGLSAKLQSDWNTGIQNWAQGLKNGSGGLLPVVPTVSCDIGSTPGRLQQPELTILSPTEGGIATYPALQPMLDFKVGSGVLSVKYELDGRELQTVLQAPFAPAIRIPRSIPNTGDHTLTVTLTDTYFNQASQSVHFHFGEDHEKPSVSFAVPSDAISIRKGSNLRIEANATDDGGIKYVELYLDDLLLARKLVPPYSLSWPLTDTTVGAHVLRAVATDFAGNTSEARVDVTVE